MDEEIVAVEVVAGMIEAEIVRGLLEAAGVPVWLSRESAGTAYGLTVGPLAQVEVYVPQRLEAAAREILRAYHEGSSEDESPPS
ncbi:MAG: hypothetical protein A2Y93_17185 [Chloroflexi bacterium RBG_13_68_17]|jgi:hypothetical protein|nr:MAG: hypothetical protein A2Y93_17185 [Chloroflexi bacterium RBG_13_68_17]